jgi:prophage tail gpP-like protein
MAAEAYASIDIGGVRYSELLKLRVHRDLQTSTGEGTFTMSWPGATVMNRVQETGQLMLPAFMDGASGQIYLDNQLAMTFRIDTRTSNGSPTQYELELHFRGLFSDGVDGSPDHKSGQENQKSPGDISQTLMKGLSAGFMDQSGASNKLERFIIAQGETVERAMRRATREFGLNFVENEAGVVELFGKDQAAGTGGNLWLGDRKITHWSVKRDMGPRASKYQVLGNTLPTDMVFGKAAMHSAQAVASGFGFQKLRTYFADSDHDKGSVKDRSGYEGARSSAQGLNVTLRVSTWTDVNGRLWKLRNLYHVRIPVDGVDEMLMLSSITFDLSPTERFATLVLTSESSFGGGGGYNVFGPSSMTETFTSQHGTTTKEEDDKKKQEEEGVWPPPEEPPESGDVWPPLPPPER